MKIYRKKFVPNLFPIFTNRLALCGTIWSTLACRVALYNQNTTTQSLFFLKTLKSRRTTHLQHELQTTMWLWTADCARFFFFKIVQQNVPRWQHQIQHYSMQPTPKFNSCTLQYVHEYIGISCAWALAAQKVRRNSGLRLQSVKGCSG